MDTSSEPSAVDLVQHFIWPKWPIRHSNGAWPCLPKFLKRVYQLLFEFNIAKFLVIYSSNFARNLSPSISDYKTPCGGVTAKFGEGRRT